MRDLPRVRQRMQNWWRGTKGFRQERPNLFVYSPLRAAVAVPAPVALDQPVRADAGDPAVDARDRVLSADRLDVPPDAARPRSARRRSIRSLTIYYCIDDFASSSPGAKRIVASEERLFKDADLVFVTSERLRRAGARASAIACTCSRSASASSASMPCASRR